MSDRPGEEVSLSELKYEDGGDPSVLDVIQIPLLNATPKAFQRENWRLDATRYWKRVGRVREEDVQYLADCPKSLWEDGFQSTTGLNNRVPKLLANGLACSLYLIIFSVEIDSLELTVGPVYDRRRVQGRFLYNGVAHLLRVTDSGYEAEYLSKLDGVYSLGECFITVSLGDLYDGYAYKLVAAIIEPE